jgi:DnaJ-class molecular chaperone
MSIRDYNNLELQPYVADELVKKQYKYLALKYHPDKNNSSEATEKFKEISQSYNNIINKKTQDSNNIIMGNDFFNLFSNMSMLERNNQHFIFNNNNNNNYSSTSIQIINGMKITKTTQVINGITKTTTTITQI